MLSEKSCVQEVVDFLNKVLELDPAGLNNLMRIRVYCSPKLVGHPTIPLHETPEGPMASAFSLINGIFGDPQAAQGSPKPLNIIPITEGSSGRIIHFISRAEHEAQN